MRDYPHHEDLGLDPQADRTPDLRPGKSDDPRAATPRPSEPSPIRDQENPIMAHTNPYPVDSATRHCCGGIGDHTAECDINLPDPDVPLPAGATTDGWNSVTAKGMLSRSVEWFNRDISAKIGVTIDGWQDADGTISRVGISVYGTDGRDPVTADEARRLAATLLAAADTLDRIGKQ